MPDSLLTVPQRGTPEYDAWVKQQQIGLAKATAAFAKANPTASPGLALNAAKAGVDPNSVLASNLTTADQVSKIDTHRNAALAAASSFKQMNNSGSGSPVDFLAPLTRTAFMALTTPYELLEATVRNVAGGRNPFNNILGQTQSGQAIAQLLTKGKVDVGTGFLDVDPNSAVGKALNKAKIAAGPKMAGGQPWTYQSGLTQALFDNPETKAARTFQAVSGFVFNLAFDPLTYVPGVGLLKVGREGVSLRLGKGAAQAKAAKAVSADAGQAVAEAKKLREISGMAAAEGTDLEKVIAAHTDDVKAALPEWRQAADNLHNAKSEYEIWDAEYGALEQTRSSLFAANKAAEHESQLLVNRRRVLEDVVAKRSELGTAARTADVEAILTSKGEEAVIKTADDLKATESTLPGLVHTSEEAALKKGGRAPVLGVADGAERVVRVAGAKKPNLLKFTGEVMPGTSAAAQRVGNALADALTPLGAAADNVIETILRDGATHADVIKAAQQSNILDAVYNAYRAIGVDGFSKVGAVRGAEGGTFAYFRQAVDMFAHDVSWWAREGEIPSLAPEVIGAEKQAATAAGAIEQQARTMVEEAAAPRQQIYRTVAEVDSALGEVAKRRDASAAALAEATARKDAAVAAARSAAKSRAEARAAFQNLNGIEREAIDAAAGLLHIDDAKVLNYRQFSDFLFGKMGRNVANMVANHYGPKDYFEVWNAFGRNISVDLAKSLAAATSEKEVLALLAAEAGIDVGVATRTQLAARAMQFKPGVIVPEGMKMQYSVAEKFFSDARVLATGKRIAESGVGQKVAQYSRFAPTKGLMNLDDGDTLVREMYNSIPFLGGSNALRDKYTKLMMDATTESERFNIFFDSLTDIVAEQMGKVTPQQFELLKEASRVFKREKDIHRNFLAQIAAEGGDVEHVLANGQKVKFSQFDPLIDSQLTKFVKWPDPNEMRQLTGALGKVMANNAWLKDTSKVVSELFDSRFKQLVLVGRVSYITRNIIDMQVRMYLAGSKTLFSHPMQFLAMMVGNPDGSGVAKQLSKLSRYDNTVFGTSFRSILDVDDEARFANTALGDADRYGVMMARSMGYGVGQGTGKLPTGMKFITSVEKNFNRAWASGILQYRASDAARLVAGGLMEGSVQNGKFVPYFKEARAFLEGKKAQGLDPVQDYVRIITDFMFETQKGNQLRKLIADVDPQARAVMMSDDIDVAREAVGAYFKTVAQGIDNLSAGSKEIRDYIAGKRMKDVTGVAQTYKADSNITRDRWLAKILAGHRNKVDVEQAIGQLRLPGEFSGAGKGLVARWDKAASDFFRVSATLEKRAALGPEYRQQYWNAVGDQFRLLSRSEGEKILAIAERELRGTKILGMPASATNPALAMMRDALKELDNTGIGVDAMHDIASGLAAKQIEKLFYDAMRQRQIAAATRLAFPFAQAWANTIGVWGGLIGKDVVNTFKLQGQARAYKAANAFEFLNHPETGALYSWMNDNWDDHSQGFIFSDPTYGDKRVMIPLAGDLLGAMLSLRSGEAVPAMPVSMSVPSLNLAFSNELLPGVGPGLQMTLGKLIDGQNGWITDQVRNIIYPFGQPSKGATGVVETFTPAWAQRLLYGLRIDSYEQKNMKTLKPIMAYLASTGNYGDMPIAPEQQTKLLDDAMKLNRTLALWRGIIANVSPGSIAPMILAKDKTGDLHVQALMVNDFAQIRANNPDNYATAIAKWADKYGDNALFTLVSGSRGGVTPTSKAWEFYVNNRDDANRYPDAFMLFFPGGEYSTEFAKWQEQQGQRFNLTPAEMQMEAARYVYSARKAKLQQDEATAIAQGEDPKAAHEVYQSRKDAMDNEFGGQPDFKSAGVPRETLVKQVTEALSNDKFASTPAGKGLAEFLKYREGALQSVQQADLKTLTGTKAKPVAEWLNSKAYELISQYPEFSVMYWRVFAAETGNN